MIRLFSFGFAYIPSAPGIHTVDISTWKVAANNYFDSLKTRFHTGGLTVSKSDLVYSGVERLIMYSIDFSSINVVIH